MKNVVPIRPFVWEKITPHEAERIIRTRAQQTGNVIFTSHARDRMEERDINRAVVFRVLRAGTVDIERMDLNEHGDWEVVIAARAKGAREVGAAVVVLNQDDQLVIKTVMWID
jgi:hypothetical protein